jgi:hypothetical protein
MAAWRHQGDGCRAAKGEFQAPLQQKQLANDIQNCNGKVTPNYMMADVILVPQGMTLKQERDAVNMKKQIEESEGGTDADVDVTIASTDWFARVYFSGKAERVPTEPALFVDIDGASLRVYVPALGDDRLRMNVMGLLERNGAISVTREMANTVILPDNSEYLDSPPERYRGKRLHPVSWVYKRLESQPPQPTTYATRRPRDPSLSTEPARVRTKPRKAPVKPIPARAHKASPIPPPREARPVVRASVHVPQDGQPARTEFTAHDRDRLAHWLAHVCPTSNGRLSRGLYERLGVSPKSQALSE